MLGDHIFAGERLQGFSDAVFAIIATIMVRRRAHALVSFPCHSL